MTFAIRRRAGITLIEVLVVVGIVAVLVAILIPAVSAVRESARRQACANNMHQIGTALNTYTTTFNVLPSGISGKGYSVHSTMLPFLGQQSLFNSLNYQLDAAFNKGLGKANSTAAFTSLATFNCPSERNLGEKSFATTNYAANGGFGVLKYGFNGVFIDGTGGDSSYNMIGYHAISDGTSHTAAFTEWVLGTARKDVESGMVAVFKLPKNTVEGAYENFVQNCIDLNEFTTKQARSKPCEWVDGTYGNSIVHFAIKPNGHSCMNGNSLAFGAITANSYHSGGVNTLFLDGHISLIPSSINASSWRALSTRSGAEVVDDF